MSSRCTWSDLGLSTDYGGVVTPRAFQTTRTPACVVSLGLSYCFPRDFATMTGDMQRLGAYIADARAEAGLTQEELGDLVGVSVKTINNWENGRTASIRPASASRLQIALGWGVSSVRAILRGDSPEPGAATPEQGAQFLRDHDRSIQQLPDAELDRQIATLMLERVRRSGTPRQVALEALEPDPNVDPVGPEHGA